MFLERSRPIRGGVANIYTKYALDTYLTIRNKKKKSYRKKGPF